MDKDYTIDDQEALRLAEKGKKLLNCKPTRKATRAVYEVPSTMMASLSREVGSFQELLTAYANAEREANKPWLIREINRWKFWLKERLNK
jgi:hypothetical protein